MQTVGTFGIKLCAVWKMWCGRCWLVRRTAKRCSVNCDVGGNTPWGYVIQVARQWPYVRVIQENRTNVGC